MLIAGRFNPMCTCCELAVPLVTHASLDASRRACAISRAVYLDRGDGVFEREVGQSLQSRVPTLPAEVQSDRPVRTEQKVRIDLEKATFAGEIAQSFPVVRNGRPEFRSWQVDVDAAASFACFPRERLQRELSSMAQHFPRWVLSLGRGRALEPCACGGLLVFDRGVRCVACGVVAHPKGVRLTWFGLMPPIGIESLTRLKEEMSRKAPGRHVLGEHPKIGRYILVPLIVAYPETYPEDSPHVFYLPELGAVPGSPSEQCGHAFHMLPQGRMCLFASGEWVPGMGVVETLQQRAYAHVVKLLNYANGKASAFAKVS